MLETLSTSILPVLMIVAAFTDVKSFRIPNWLTALIAILFFPMAYFTGMPLDVFGYHVLMGVVLFGVGFLFFSLGLFGGGDAKLFAAAGLWFGVSQTIPFITYSVLVGGVLAIAVGSWCMIQMDWTLKDTSFIKRFSAVKPNVPYGFAIAVGAIFAFPATWWMGGLS